MQAGLPVYAAKEKIIVRGECRMQNERENLNLPLDYVEYDISGNSFRAYYDADGKIVFVLDFTESAVKPNVLLVMNPVGDRKWDDILMNDYGMDLELVRPKKDNKYQKLDIEYAGLAEYDALIHANQSGVGLADALRNISQFHDDAARRAAYERLGAAELQADRARDTIEKTNVTIADLQARLKSLRAKLVSQRRDIGREPTKQSAAKILRTETQIDAANSKLKRAKKRLQNAQRRLSVADEEAERANNILAILDDKGAGVAMEVSVQPKSTGVVAYSPAAVSLKKTEDLEEDFIEPKAEDMADEEVKPLFDTDPKILNDEIAFKPVDFGVSSDEIVAPVENLPAVADDELLPMPAPQTMAVPVVDENDGYVVSEPDVVEEEPISDVVPLSFTPPLMQEETNFEVEPVVAPKVPVLDSITPVVEPVSHLDEELMPIIEVPHVAQPQVEAPVVQDLASSAEMADEATASYAPQPLPEIEPAPIDTGMRPVSPIARGAVVADVVAAVQERKKNSALYYFLLIILIVLSVFTLWLYQGSMNKAMPELGNKVVQEEIVVVAESPEQEVSEDKDETVAEKIVEEPVEKKDVEPVVVDVEPEPVPVVEPEPVQVAPVVESEPVPVISEPTVSTIKSMSAALVEDEKKTEVPTEEEVLARKPAYSVSQNEKMFVADEEYETEKVSEIEEIEEIEESDVMEELDEVFEPTGDVQVMRPEVVVENESLPAATNQIVTQEVFEESEVVNSCAEGRPDADGCCAGEELYNVDGEYMCCAIGTEDCFPPMI